MIEVQDLRRINVQPGDVFVIRVPAKHVSPEAVDVIKARFREAVGPDNPVMAIGDGVDITVYRPVDGS